MYIVNHVDSISIVYYKLFVYYSTYFHCTIHNRVTQTAKSLWAPSIDGTAVLVLSIIIYPTFAFTGHWTYTRFVLFQREPDSYSTRIGSHPQTFYQHKQTFV